MIKTVVIDAGMGGIAGDMIIGSLLDINKDPKRIYELSKTIEDNLNYVDKFELEISKTARGGIEATDVEPIIEEDVHELPANEVKKQAIEIAKKMGLSENSLQFSETVFEKLIKAEAGVHGVSEDSVHLHEIASSDTVFDVVGVALLLEELQFLDENTEIYSTPPALGGGFIETAHGTLPVPAPATLKILEENNFKTSQSTVEAELTTPTGAALLTSLTDDVVELFPPLKLQETGYGSGSNDFEGTPNALRIVQGENFKATKEKIIAIETNLDDVQGENLGYLIEKLMKNGAYDVDILPAVGKKNRPANVVKIMADRKNYEKLVDILIEETGTLGVRVLETPRIIADRRKEDIDVQVSGEEYKVTVKISKTKDGKLINKKPEYDDLKKIAEDSDLALREVSKRVEKQIMEKDRF